MENESLEELQHFLPEEIYLTPEDRKSVLASLEAGHKSVQKTEIPALEEEEEVKPEPIAVQGTFAKGILILHEENELSPEVMDMLVKMITAVGHSMSDVGLLNSEKLENRSMEDFQAINAHVVLKFGRIKHPINALPASPYEVYSDEGTEYLFADALSVISETKELKRKLWNSLQVVFNLTA
ncbi:MAG: hypothetical protein B7Z16_08190 [Algoriphagus sp. 32-45-6]|nr:MAG: hypothetical protein B7Z16_08190 [Algoriphagus sp. 32-45-6]